MALGYSSGVLWPRDPVVAVPTTGYRLNINGGGWFVNGYLCICLCGCYNHKWSGFELPPALDSQAGATWA